MAGAVLIVTASLAVLAFAVSVVAFLVQTSRHRSSRGWAAAAGASLVLVLVFGGIANAVRGEGSPSPSEEQAGAANNVEQAEHDATVTVTRAVDGDTIEISPSFEGLSTVRLIGVDTPQNPQRNPTLRSGGQRFHSPTSRTGRSLAGTRRGKGRPLWAAAGLRLPA